MTSPALLTLPTDRNQASQSAPMDRNALRTEIHTLETRGDGSPATNRRIASLYRQLYPTGCYCGVGDCPLCNPLAALVAGEGVTR